MLKGMGKITPGLESQGQIRKSVGASKLYIIISWLNTLGVREHTRPDGTIDGFKVVFRYEYWVFHFGGLETLSPGLIKEHGPVVRAKAMGWRSASQNRGSGAACCNKHSQNAAWIKFDGVVVWSS